MKPPGRSLLASSRNPCFPLAMVMMLPFLLGLAAAICTMARLRRAAIGIWVLLLLVLVAWLKYHATDSLGLSF